MVGGSWTRLEKNFRKTSSTNDDDNDVVSESILFILLYFYFYFFLLLPMMIRVVRVRPEGRVLQPVCFLWVCDG